MDTNDVNRSRYLVVNTKANKIWLFPDIPVIGKKKNLAIEPDLGRHFEVIIVIHYIASLVRSYNISCSFMHPNT